MLFQHSLSLVSFFSVDAFITSFGAADYFEKDVKVHDCMKELKLRDASSKIPGMSVSLMAHQIIGVAWMARQEKGA